MKLKRNNKRLNIMSSKSIWRFLSHLNEAAWYRVTKHHLGPYSQWILIYCSLNFSIFSYKYSYNKTILKIMVRNLFHQKCIMIILDITLDSRYIDHMRWFSELNLDKINYTVCQFVRILHLEFSLSSRYFLAAAWEQIAKNSSALWPWFKF